MNAWNQLLGLLDRTIGFPNKVRSYVKKKMQYFDQRTSEHVFVLEYRIKVRSGLLFKESPVANDAELAMLRELMDVGFVHTEDSSPSPRSPEKAKRATAKTSQRQRKIRPKPSASPIRPG